MKIPGHLVRTARCRVLLDSHILGHPGQRPQKQQLELPSPWQHPAPIQAQALSKVSLLTEPLRV